jgi:hypothetical protein
LLIAVGVLPGAPAAAFTLQATPSGSGSGDAPRIEAPDGIVSPPLDAGSSIRRVGRDSNHGPTGRRPVRGARISQPRRHEDAVLHARASRSRAVEVLALDFSSRLALARAGLIDWRNTAPPPSPVL